ncbi:18256_t:CDS:2, partial [Gigaspora rosea]
ILLLEFPICVEFSTKWSCLISSGLSMRPRGLNSYLDSELPWVPVGIISSLYHNYVSLSK